MAGFHGHGPVKSNYQNGPLPTWLAWYAHHLPHWFHATTAALTLALELVLIFAVFLPRGWRIALFFVITPWQAGISLDQQLCLPLNAISFWSWAFCCSMTSFLRDSSRSAPAERHRQPGAPFEGSPDTHAPNTAEAARWRRKVRLWVQAFFLTWIFYATSVLLILMLSPQAQLPALPVLVLEPFRIANDFGLFAVMTRERYEIEFQGSRDGQTWTAYPFRYKPQDASTTLMRIYARPISRVLTGIFGSHRWATGVSIHSCSTWEQRLLSGEPDVLFLFAGNPFPERPLRAGPRGSVAILVFRLERETRAGPMVASSGNWARYADASALTPDGKITVLAWPNAA